MSCTSDTLNYSSSFGSLGMCSHILQQAAELPVTLSGIKVMPCITVGMCMHIYISPGPCTMIRSPNARSEQSPLRKHTTCLLKNAPQFYLNG